eukprot:1976234-Rhodomonas_salina.1
MCPIPPWVTVPGYSGTHVYSYLGTWVGSRGLDYGGDRPVFAGATVPDQLETKIVLGMLYLEIGMVNFCIFADLIRERKLYTAAWQ